MNLKKLFGRAEQAAPKLTEIEKALIDSLRTEPEKWFFNAKDSEATAQNRERGVFLTFPADHPFEGYYAKSGKLRFSPLFAGQWCPLANKLREDRIERDNKAEATRTEAEFKKAFKL